MNKILDFCVADDAKKVQTALIAHGMNPATAYNRLLRNDKEHGFEPWEIHGIFNCVEEFTGKTIADLSPMPTFYARTKGKDKFCQFMAERGLGKNSVIKRFRRWDFKPWELLGVNNIIKDAL